MAPKAWSAKRERQYNKIEKSAKQRGKSDKQAKEIAARTVNKTRRKQGETKSGKRSTSGTGNPNVKLEDRSRQELYNIAKNQKIKGRSKLNKQGLVKAIERKS